MQFEWLNKEENNRKIIVFFNGWGMNKTPVQNLKCDDFDILMISDYRNIEFDFSCFDFLKYSEKYLVCWSMGVFAANFFKKTFDKFNKKIAINGTGNIISNEFGIPDKIYKATLKFLSEETVEKFIKNMFNIGCSSSDITVSRTIDELREELISIQNLKPKEEIKYNKVIISKSDKIIPTVNQINFWKSRADYEIINSTHCLFDMYSGWQEIVC